MLIETHINGFKVESELEIEFNEQGYIEDYTLINHHYDDYTYFLFKNLTDEQEFEFVHSCVHANPNKWNTINDIFDIGCKLAVYIENLLVEEAEVENDISYYDIEHLENNDLFSRTLKKERGSIWSEWRYYGKYTSIDEFVKEYV